MVVIWGCDIVNTVLWLVISFTRMIDNFNIQAAAIIPDNRPSPAWPDRGHVTFNSYSTRYREGLDLVLKDINADFPSGTKVSYRFLFQS